MHDTALVLIDMQNDYFPDGKWALEGINAAADNAASLLSAFRHTGRPIIHIRHESTRQGAPFFVPGTEGANIHAALAPQDDEPVIVKHQINAFIDTPLKQTLDARQIRRLIICGAMSHMCIDSTTRAAHDLGYECLVVHDACATKSLRFGDLDVPAAQVHAAFMHALGFAFATVLSREQVLKQYASPPAASPGGQ